MNLEGRLLGNRYELLRKIGNGGMATVYRAKDHILNRNVAVKILKDEFTTDEEFVKRFNTEATSVASLTHPNIVSVYDVGHEGTLYYIVMELIQGKTLKEIIVAEGKLNWKWSVNVAIQIASALETAHRNNIIHRDIKPHNIIITEDGIAKVTDFGIAKSVSNSTITAFGTTLGSVHYFSPEHARGGITDAKSDIYSLGVVLYEMLTGKVPFDADTPVSVALKHMQEEPVEPRNLNPEIPIAMNNIILKAMKKDPNERYQSATEMLKDLTLALKNPDGTIVQSNTLNDFPTQVIPTIERQRLEQKNKDTEKDKKTKKENFFTKHKGLIITLILIFLFALSLGGTILFMNLTKPKDVQVPNLVGKTVEEVKNTLKETKLSYEIKEEKYDTKIDKGLVISQEPEYKSNYRIKENQKMQIVVSLGQKLTNVPKVTGMTEEEAKKMLDESELEVVVIEEFDKKVEKGIVIKQDVDPETEVGAGSTVTITVSKGVEESTVPNVIGKSKADAIKEIEEAGLTVSATLTEEDRTKDDGVVIKQSFEGGQTVEKGASMTITVNQIAQLIEGTVTVNLKSLRKYEDRYENKANTIGNTVEKVLIEPNTVKLRVTVDGENVIDGSYKENETKITAPMTGVGTVEVKLYMNDNLKFTKLVNLKNQKELVFE